ncbi:hypothetical protein NCS57_00640800 [Fusarium keratoplasticum]|uniref:Uncharacterized protein n=1 Tax=Fusarium keratoplasticum TaxID=1328300 RepID=A0ACC0R3T6_9HYPO|nr:hypothetical protein NCS57_00640800 [Fusarium keratoplasticum]KAI8671650.1 hypothetical protein NCS57_00640800 [Fusarium keratoplasticum]
MGTTGRSGPGFIADEQRLNVILSRQKSGLLVVDDIDDAGSLGKDKKKKGKGTQMVTFGANGEAIYVGSDTLGNMYKALMDCQLTTTSEELNQKANRLEIKSKSDVVTAAANECLQGQIQLLNSLVNIAWDALPPTFQRAMNQKFPESFDLKERVQVGTSLLKSPPSPKVVASQAPVYKAPDMTIDSAFTNTAMRNFSVSDWNQLRTILRHVPLCHPFWRVYASLGKEIWEGEWDTSIIPQVPLAEFDVDLLPLRQWMDGDVREQFGCAECSMPSLNAGQLVQHRRDCHNLLHSSHSAEEAHTGQDAVDQDCWDTKHQNDKEGLTPLKN